MRRVPLKRNTPLPARKQPLERRGRLRSRRRPNPLSAAEAEARDVWGEGLGGCIVCPVEGGVCSGPIQGHHALDKALLKKRGLHAFLWDIRNRVPVCADRHESHTNRSRPIAMELLPAPVFEFARELGLCDLLARRHPPMGLPRRSGVRGVPRRPTTVETRLGGEAA